MHLGVSPAFCLEDEVDAQQSEDSAAIKILKDAHKKSSSRFKVAANDSFDDDYAGILTIMEIVVMKRKLNYKQLQAQLSKRQPV